MLQNTLNSQWFMAAQEDIKKQCEIALLTNTTLWPVEDTLRLQCPSECRGSYCDNGRY